MSPRVRPAAGRGSARLSFRPASEGSRATPPCDGSVVRRRITMDQLVRIDVNGDPGATGMVAWRIERI
ncbi:hypothetical protein [Streptomyces sp. NPDC005017]|uniref:hypothetical protein n=1 Tax=Streptomyces sp. NPDC005017 TaxID=3364706 RepID=UPI0036CA59E2